MLEIEDEWTKWKLNDRKDSIGLDVSYDMGWQRKSSGRSYDSLSGHGFLIGLSTNKIIGMRVYSKVCAICDSSQDDPKREHECPKNWYGSSGSMECHGALDLWNEIYQQYNKKGFLKTF